ncbi:MAG: DoxX family membrane protein [Bdellovibrionota bacterium]|nr:DoxX family membrane protein [Bdellovibrionota bacterium]
MEKNFKEINYLLFRLIMGLNMLIHGAVRIFGDYDAFIKKMQGLFATSPLPSFITTFAAHLISPLELFFGLLLVLGLFTRITITVLLFNMMMLISGVCLLQKWDLAGLQMSYALYLFFLGHFIDFNRFSLDNLRRN